MTTSVALPSPDDARSDAWAASRTRLPRKYRLVFWWVATVSLFPENEPPSQ